MVVQNGIYHKGTRVSTHLHFPYMSNQPRAGDNSTTTPSTNVGNITTSSPNRGVPDHDHRDGSKPRSSPRNKQGMVAGRQSGDGDRKQSGVS